MKKLKVMSVVGTRPEINMGVAQGMDILLDLAERLRARSDVGFLFVGRGSDARRLAADAQARGLDNVLFRDEIHPDCGFRPNVTADSEIV
ncbi:hypothetical protein [Aromatoleum aromaticum]|uniref:hypothetical protein n=1 Tax=Aromatoleum aromaticum TaxID=551760 RepID=UPI002006EDB6|nr:hypothetical protein [Aromatoleum aromaticum]